MDVAEGGSGEGESSAGLLAKEGLVQRVRKTVEQMLRRIADEEAAATQARVLAAGRPEPDARPNDWPDETAGRGQSEETHDSASETDRGRTEGLSDQGLHGLQERQTSAFARQEANLAPQSYKELCIIIIIHYYFWGCVGSISERARCKGEFGWVRRITRTAPNNNKRAVAVIRDARQC